MRESVTFQLPPAAAPAEAIFADPKGREAFDVTEDTHELTQSGNSATGSTDSPINSSHRSTGSHGSSSKSPSLRGNLTREHKDRDPFNVFSTVKILGKGSMGNVSLVRRRTVGGSARFNAEARAVVQEKYDKCFQLPIIGGCLQLFLQGKAQAEMEEASLQPLNGRSALIVMDKTESSTADATSLADGTQPIYAMKSIHYNLIKDKVFVDELLNEVAVLKALDHPHIVRIQETFDYKSQLYVVMEVCSGGDLYTRDPYTEEQAARIISAVLSAVSYMHQRNVIHRDIKYENILFANESPMASVKLIDFGLSQEMKDHEHITDSAGTIYTMAPEVLKGDYHKEADLWSIGVVAYMLCSSKMPFFGNKRREVVNKIMNGEFDFKGRRWKNTSAQAKSFVEDLLVMDPEERATADDALAASWLQRRHAASVRAPRTSEFKHIQHCIMEYVKYPRLRKLALMVIAHQTTSDETSVLRKIFQFYDKDHSGTLDYDQFKGALCDAGYSDDDYRELFDAVDVDGTGVIRYTEFLAATIHATGWISEERLAAAFDRVDHDDTGYITKENLRFLLGPTFPEEEIVSIMKEASTDKRGISYSDFLSQWNDDKEEYVNRWREHMIPEVLEESKEGTGRPPLSSEVSELSLDGSDEGGHSDFVKSKALSVRKKLDVVSAVV